MRRYAAINGLLLAVFTLPLFAETMPAPTVFFDTHCRNGIVATLDKATNSITVACYKLSDPILVQLLMEKHQSGIQVQIKIDASQLKKKRTKAAAKLLGAGISVTPIVLPDEGHMHNKFAIVDAHTLIVGSCNWSDKALSKNHENLMTLKSTSLALQYQQYWDEL